MIKAHRDSLRLLQTSLGAAIALPLALFVYSCWLDYRNVHEVVDKQIERTTDVINEHALKVLEAVEHSIAQVAEMVRDLPDDAIAAQESELHARLRSIADSSSQTKSLWVFDRNGKALVNSLSYPVDTTKFADRDYFAAHVDYDVGTYVGAVLWPRAPYTGAPFFGISRRRISPDGEFLGVVQASVLPEYFEGFYEKLAREPGSYASIVREDGTLLARYPSIGREAKLAEQGPLYRAMMAQPARGRVTLVSAIDGQGRTVTYRKLPDFPVFVLAGLSAAAIRDQWLAQVWNKLIFGVPATAALIAIIIVALRRTRRLYAEETARHSAEGALKQAQRLEALGQLTGGVAHDFNNLLMIIGASAERLKSRIADAQTARSLSMIETAVRKGTGLTRQLLSFSRRQSLSPRVIDLAACIGEVAEMLRQSLRGAVGIRFNLPDSSVPVRIDRNEFEVALLNLILNARDAMPNGGEIIVTLQSTIFDAADGPDGKAGVFAVVRISDTGVGIPDAIRDHVFEPFFTTKRPDSGTGLGLSQVYGFVRQSDGDISFETQEGRGTTFTIILPCSTEPLDSEARAPSSVPSVPALRVLLVEDNKDVAIVAADYFNLCGCSVVKAASAEEALETLSRNPAFDLVFSDIAMPGMNGLELARLVREHHPEIHVVLASAYSDKAPIAASEGFTLLEKPYSLETLKVALARTVQIRPDAA